jgi:hypothetical protein
MNRGVFVLSREGNTNIALPVHVAFSGTASNGLDYQEISRQITIPKGRWAVEIPVIPLRDELKEGNENVVMHIMPIVCVAIYPPPPECYQVGLQAEALVRIEDCPPPEPNLPVVTVRAPDPMASEPCVTAQIDAGMFVISRSSGTNYDLSVSIALDGTAQNGVDYHKIPEKVIIPKGRLAVEVPLVANWDDMPEASETAIMRILPGACAGDVSNCYKIGELSQAAAEIRDCAIPRAVVTVRAADPYASEPCAQGDAERGWFVINRSGVPDFEMFVNIAISGTAENGVDYLLMTNRVFMPEGKSSVEVPVKPLADGKIEGPENVAVRILPPFCPETVVPLPAKCYLIGQPAEASVFIRDCEPAARPNVRITRPLNGQAFPPSTPIEIRAETRDPDGYCWKAEFFAGSTKLGERVVAFLIAPTNGTMIPFEFTWKEPPVGQHVLTVRATDSTGFVGVSEPVSITVGQPITNKVPVVSIVASEPLAIEGTNCWGWSNPTNRYPEATAQVPSYSFYPERPIWWFTNCGPKNATFTIRRSGSTNEDLTVYYLVRGTATNGVDYELLPSNVVIPAGSRKAPVLIVPKEDNVLERVETVVLELVHPPYANPLPPPYLIGRPGRAAAAIVDSSNPRLPLGPLPDRSFYIGTPGSDGSWYTVQRSMDMQNWETVCTNQVIQGAVQFVDPDAADVPRQFYRALPVPEPEE